MRRILHIIPTLDRSGAEKQLTLLAAGLPRDEFEAAWRRIDDFHRLVEEAHA